MAAKQPHDHKTTKNQPKTVEAMGVTLAVSPAIFATSTWSNTSTTSKPPSPATVPRVRHRPLPQEALRPPVHGHEGRIAPTRHRRVSIDKVSEFIAQLLEQVAPNS